MKIDVQIDLSLDEASYWEIRRILAELPGKVNRQLLRSFRPKHLCTAPKADDLIFDYLGRRIGTVKATIELEEEA